jgi:hypothetical protein
VFEEPRGDRFYTLAVDPAQGVGKDYTVAQIWSYGDEGEPYIAASWWSNTTEQAQAAKETFVMGRLWRGYRKEAMLGWDAAGGQGNLMVHVWRSLGYSELCTRVVLAGFVT